MIISVIIHNRRHTEEKPRAYSGTSDDNTGNLRARPSAGGLPPGDLFSAFRTKLSAGFERRPAIRTIHIFLQSAVPAGRHLPARMLYEINPPVSVSEKQHVAVVRP